MNNPNKSVPAHWVAYKKGDNLPNGINIVNFDDRGYPICIGRFKKTFTFQSDKLPGEFSVRNGLVTSTWGGRVYQVPDDVELLCDGNLDWQPSERGKMHKKQVSGGQGYIPSSRPGFEPLGIGKCVINEKTVVGKISGNYKCLFVPKENREHEVGTRYYILVDLRKS